MNEIDTIHPLVEEWLTENGYEYKHEFKLPKKGRVDFVGIHSDTKQTILVEVKANHVNKVIDQILRYGSQVPEAELYIAMPQSSITDALRADAQEHGIQIIELDIEPTPVATAKRTTIYLADEDLDNFRVVLADMRPRGYANGLSGVIRILLAKERAFIESRANESETEE